MSDRRDRPSRPGPIPAGRPEAADEADPIEILGRRIGRVLSVVLTAGLVVWLGVQLRWWP